MPVAEQDETGRKGIALLLDCDDRMAEAVGRVTPGYTIKQWVSGSGAPPIRAYDADLIIDSSSAPQRYDKGAYGDAYRRWALSGRKRKQPIPRDFVIDPGAPAWIVDEGTGRRRVRYPILTRHYDLFEAQLAIRRGAICIIFVNPTILRFLDRSDLYKCLTPGLVIGRIPEPGCTPSRCEGRPPGVWGDFFERVRKPITTLVSLDAKAWHDAAWKHARIRREPGLEYLAEITPTWPRVEPCLVNRANQELALMIRDGAGAVFVLPEFEDNAAAAVRLIGEIWPKLRVPSRPKRAASSRPNATVDATVAQREPTRHGLDPILPGETGERQMDLSQRLDLFAVIWEFLARTRQIQEASIFGDPEVPELQKALERFLRHTGLRNAGWERDLVEGLVARAADGASVEPDFKKLERALVELGAPLIRYVFRFRDGRPAESLGWPLVPSPYLGHDRQNWHTLWAYSVDWLGPRAAHARNMLLMRVAEAGTTGDGAASVGGEQRHEAPLPGKVLILYRTYTKLLVEHERVRRVYKPGDTIEVNVWEWVPRFYVITPWGRATECEPEAVGAGFSVVGTYDRPKYTDLWRTLLSVWTENADRDDRRIEHLGATVKPFGALWEERNLMNKPQFAKIRHVEYLEILQTAIDIVCDEIAGEANKSGRAKPWGDERELALPETPEHFVRLSHWLRDRDPRGAEAGTVAHILDNADFPAITTRPVTTAARLRAEEPSPRGGVEPSRKRRLWTRLHCPSCGSLGVKFISQREFARKSGMGRSAVGKRVNDGIYWSDGLKKIPWCEHCKAKTPEGEGVELSVDALATASYKPSREDASTASAWAAQVVEEEFGLPRPDPDLQPSEGNEREQEAHELMSVGVVAILQAAGKQGGMPTRDAACQVATNAMRQHRMEDQKSRRASRGDLTYAPIDQSGIGRGAKRRKPKGSIMRKRREEDEDA